MSQKRTYQYPTFDIVQQPSEEKKREDDRPQEPLYSCPSCKHVGPYERMIYADGHNYRCPTREVVTSRYRRKN